MKSINYMGDLCVIGGGLSGLCCAIAAARNGLKTYLVQDRPVLGGNASEEIRMWVCGAKDPDNRETGIIEELMLENFYINKGLKYPIWDSVLYEKAMAEENLTLLLNTSCFEAKMNGNEIESIRAWQSNAETYHIIKAKYFADCSGDSILSTLTGAEFMYGREAKSEFNETIPPDVADKKTMGMSCLMQIRETPHKQEFIPPKWAYKYETDADLPFKDHDRDNNFWWIEIGGEWDCIHDTDKCRDELLKICYGVWDHMKNYGDHGVDNWELEWIGFLPGKSTWQGEAQWRKYTLDDLGVYSASNHVNVSAGKISFCGSQTTSEHFPILIISNIKKNETWIFEIEPTYGYYFEIGVMGDDIYVEANSAFMCNGGWSRKLKAGECYNTSKAFYTRAEGDIHQALKRMYNYKRKHSMTSLNIPPVVFNDYMNCLWAKPTKEKLIPLIDAAADVGCEIFCIDDGWQGTKWGADSLGDWQPNEKLFGEVGFEGIVKYIKEKNMRSGVWLEMESCSAKSKAYEALRDCLITRNNTIIGGERAFFDFRQKEVRDYIMGCIDNLYNKGIRYIKNDYNHNICLGCDGADSLSEGLAEHREAFLLFIDEVKKKYFDLIIEGCASGGMRADYGLVKHVDLQSISDQEFYYNNPAITAGMFAYLPPEKCGLWSYPYPLLYDEQPEETEYFDKTIDSDNEETIFNMINSMLGVMYLSGHIEQCDDCSCELIKEAVNVYKEYRYSILESEPVYITRPLRIDENGIMSFGLKTKKGTVAAIWKINTESETVNVKIPTELGTTAKLIYPTKLETEYEFKDGILKIILKNNCAARLFLIK